MKIGSNIQLPSLVYVTEFESTKTVGEITYTGRVILFNPKGGEALVVDLPENDALWGAAETMQARMVHLPYMSKQKITHTLYLWANIQPTLKDTFIFIVFPELGWQFRFHVYDLPYGNLGSSMGV